MGTLPLWCNGGFEGACRGTGEGRHPRVVHGVARGGFPVWVVTREGWRGCGLAGGEQRVEWVWARWEMRMAGVLASGSTESTVGTHIGEREGAIRELNKGDPVSPHKNKEAWLGGSGPGSRSPSESWLVCLCGPCSNRAAYDLRHKR